MIIKGKSFDLRPWKKGDEPSLVENANNRKIWINLTNKFPHPYTMKDAKKWIKIATSQNKKRITFAIMVNNKAVGGIGFTEKDDLSTGTAEIGYWLGEKYWGQGIATEAIKLITDYGFKIFKYRRIEAMVIAWNPASARVLEKAGYVREAILAKRVLKDNKIADEFVYARINQSMKGGHEHGKQ